MSKLRQLRENLRLSQSALAKLVGTSQPQIRRLEAGDRKLTREWAVRLAPHLKTTAQSLLFDQIDDEGLPVVGTIQAGQFRDISLQNDDPDVPHIAIARDNRFPHARQYALLVAGDSMDLLFAEGSYVVCANFADLGIEMRPGLIVHVERMIAGTQLVETTLKEVGPANGSVVLVPRSSNPKHTPFALDGDESVEVKLKGVVIGKWEPVPL